MATTTHGVPYLVAADPPSLHGITTSMAAMLEETLLTGASSIIATEEARTNVAYGTLTTPDTVTVVLPAAGFIQVAFTADVKESVNNAAGIGIHADGTAILEATGLQTAGTSSGTYGGVTTSEVIPTTTGKLNFVPYTIGTWHQFAWIMFKATSGSHTINVRYLASSGTVTAKNRELFVRYVPRP